ncbi:MAG: hypothetical protein AAGH38_02820 [Pseudomonadota bacterium]
MTLRVARSLKFHCDAETAFGLIAATPPTITLPQAWPTPGVTSFVGAKVWEQPGDGRHLTMNDGTVLNETLISIDHDRSDLQLIKTTLTGFDGWFGRLLETAIVEWRAEATSNSTCAVTWTVEFVPASERRAPLLWMVVKPIWPRLLARGLRALSDQMVASCAHPATMSNAPASVENAA